MARPKKKNLDYFPFETKDSKLMNNIKIKYGVFGWGVIIKILQEIYGGDNGFYVKNDESFFLNLLDNCNTSPREQKKIKEVFEYAIKINYFDKGLATEQDIFTSKEIQMNYILATKKRKSFEMKKKYCLLDEEDFEEINFQPLFKGSKIYNNYWFSSKEKEVKVDKKGSKSGNNYNKSDFNNTNKIRLNEIKQDESKLNENKVNKKSLSIKDNSIILKKQAKKDFQNIKLEELKRQREIAGINWLDDDFESESE